MAAPGQVEEINHKKKKKKKQNQTNSKYVEAEIKTEPVEEGIEDLLISSTTQERGKFKTFEKKVKSRNLKTGCSKVFSKHANEELNCDSSCSTPQNDDNIVDGKHIHRKKKKKRKADALDGIQSWKACPDKKEPLSDEKKKEKKRERRSEEPQEEILGSEENKKSIVSFTSGIAKQKKRKQKYHDHVQDLVNDGQGKSKQIPNETQDLLNSTTDQLQGGSRNNKEMTKNRKQNLTSSCSEGVNIKVCDSNGLASHQDNSLEMKRNISRKKKKTKRRHDALDGIQSQEPCPENNEQVPNEDCCVKEITRTSPLLHIEHLSHKLKKKKKKKKKGVRLSEETQEEIIVRGNMSTVSLTTDSVKHKKRKQKHGDHDRVSDSEEKSKQVPNEEQYLWNSRLDDLQGGSRKNKEMMNISNKNLQSECSEDVIGKVCDSNDLGLQHVNSQDVGRNICRKKKKTKRRHDALDGIRSQEPCPESNILHADPIKDCIVGRSSILVQTENLLHEPKKKKKKVKREEPLEENRCTVSLSIDKKRELNCNGHFHLLNGDDQGRTKSKRIRHEEEELREESRKQKRRKKTKEVFESSSIRSKHDDSMEDVEHIRTKKKKKKKIRHGGHDGIQSQETYSVENEVHEGSASSSSHTESQAFKIKKEKKNMDESSPGEMLACEIGLECHKKRPKKKDRSSQDLSGDDNHNDGHTFQTTLEMTSNEKSHSKKRRKDKDSKLEVWNHESSSEDELDDPNAACDDNAETSHLHKGSRNVILGWKQSEPVDNSWMDDLPTVFDDEETWGEGLPIDITQGTWENVVVKEGVVMRKGRWDGIEDNILRENVINFCKRYGVMVPKMIIMPFLYGFPDPLMRFSRASKFKFRICKGLRRLPYSVYVRSRKIFDERNYRGGFTKEEEEKVHYYLKLYGKKWSKIGREVNRSGQSVLDRYRGIKIGKASGKWSDEEVQQLTKAIMVVTGKKEGEDINTLVGIPWREVHKMVPTRTIYQCHEKWCKVLSWQVGNRDIHRWNVADSVLLIERMYVLKVNDESDIDWEELHKDFSARSPSPMKLHTSWRSLKQMHIANYNFLPFEEILDELYHIVRPLLKRKIRSSMES